MAVREALAAELTHAEIARATGLSRGRIDQIAQSGAYKSARAPECSGLRPRGHRVQPAVAKRQLGRSGHRANGGRGAWATLEVRWPNAMPV
jgi:hypothetical protein